MLDTNAIEQLVKQQIEKQVNEQVAVVLGSDEWLNDFEQKVLQFLQARVLATFSNGEALPEITDTVKNSVADLFKSGAIPGIGNYVDSSLVQKTVDSAVENNITALVDQICADPDWTARVEKLINQTTAEETMSRLSSIDIGPIIKQRVDENMKLFTNSLVENFTSTGISDQATKCELVIMDDAVVIESSLVTNNIETKDTLQVQNLVVTGSVNTDNESWTALATEISQQTLNQITTEWNNSLVDQVVNQIQEQGIDFEQILVGGKKVIDGNQLSSAITSSNLQSVGILKNLSVNGEATFNNTLSVLNQRIGINTDSPEKALSVWDEEVSVVIGKHKMNQAYIGTNREQGITIGVNRDPQIEISSEGLTRIKQLQVGLHKISHAPQVPGWSGTRGDIVFNSNPGADRVFAWVCLGAYKWQTLKTAE
jgi:hypothetical protein